MLSGRVAGQLGEVSVDCAHCNRAFTDRLRNALDRSVAHVTDRKYSRKARFEWLGRAQESASRGGEIVARQNKPSLIPLHDIREPLGTRLRADHDKQGSDV